ncbi:MAG TPA: homoserine kinase [Verrucomicrobiota bacterium]|nr:homoserine kinase [Verrucomicrobiota bacterium]
MASNSSSVTIRVPGATSNLGPGFDSLGLALRLYNEITVTRASGRAIRLISPVTEESRLPATNLLNAAAQAFFRRSGVRPFGCAVAIAGEVPLARGLGSSVTARLGCAAGLNELSGGPLTRDGLFQLVTQLEGHPDNAAPAIFGGFTAASMVGREARAIRFPVHRRAKFVTLIPDFEISTPAARKLMPHQYSKADAVHNLTRVALITAAFASGSLEALRGCFDDRLHQPYRQQLIPQLTRVIKAGERAGAIGGWLSGSGSTIICLTLEHPDTVGAAMQRVLPNSQIHILSADTRGFQVLQ